MKEFYDCHLSNFGDCDRDQFLKMTSDSNSPSKNDLQFKDDFGK